jgi:hypothetical protein
VALDGSVSSTRFAAVAVNGTSSSRCSELDAWVVADGRTRLTSRSADGSGVVALSFAPYAA